MPSVVAFLAAFAICAFLFGIHAPDASAKLKRPNAAFSWNGTKWVPTNGFKNVLRNGNTTVPPIAEYPLGDADTVQKYLDDARMKSKRLPNWRVLGRAGLTIALSESAIYLYSQAFKMSIPGQGFIYRLVSGENWNPADATGYYTYRKQYYSDAGTYTYLTMGNPGTCQVQLSPCRQSPYADSATYSINQSTGVITRPSGSWALVSGTLNAVLPQTVNITGNALCNGNYTANSATNNTVTVAGLPGSCTGSIAITLLFANAGYWNAPEGWYFVCSGSAPSGPNGCYSQTYCQSSSNTPVSFSQNTYYQFEGYSGTKIPITGNANGACSGASDYRVKYLGDPETIPDGVRMKKADPSDYDASPNKHPLTYNPPDETDEDWEKVPDAYSSGNDCEDQECETQTPEQEAAEAAVVKTINPSETPETIDGPGNGSTVTTPSGTTVTPAVVFAPFTVPMPLPSETYQDYIERLRAKGYVGDITLADEDATFPAESAGAKARGQTVTRIQVGTGTQVRVYDATTGENIWPQNAPKITGASVPTEVTIKTGFAEQIVDTTCGPTEPAIDFDPFKTIDPGAKFPFGIPGFIAGSLAPMVAVGEAPVFDIPIHLGEAGEGSIHIDFSPANPYMAILRLLFAIGIGITSIWLLATSLLGFRAGHSGGGMELEAED